ncbi:MAG TPA: thymidylate synthase [Candidatus Moranbacteria bacterium]|nr:thymidylate synthase [Candidatus Moranbacteria bacterium]
MQKFENIVPMKPLKKRTPDNQYKELLREILEKGIKADFKSGAVGPDVDALTLVGPRPMRFRLENGFPMITERNMDPKMSALPVTIWRQAIAEICAFINGARTVEKLEEFGVYWWKDWCTEKKCAKRGLPTGDLGPGSYGAAFHDFPTSEGIPFNQFKNIIEQIKEEPQLRTHFISPWIPQYIGRGKNKIQKVVVCPCHGWLNIRIIGGKLILNMIQRSGDVPIGVPSNMVQYAALTMMLAHATNTIPYEYVHTISDAHIYIDQIPAVEKMLERESRAFPTMKMNIEKKDLFDFRKEDFELSDYNPHPGIKGIPVMI